eukprot:gene13329-9162_t
MSRDLESALLQALSKTDAVVSDHLATELRCSHQEVVGAAKSLEADGYILSELQTKQRWKLSAEALEILSKGSPEFRLWEMLSGGPVSQAAAQERLGGKEVMSVALANGMKQKRLSLDKSKGPEVQVCRNASCTVTTDTVRELLQSLQSSSGPAHVDPKDADSLKKRKLATLETVKVFRYTKGPQYAPQRAGKAATDLTRDMLQDGSWKTTAFKRYNFSANGIEVSGGQLHPLLKVRQEFREIFMELGFQEMNTQQWVSSSFWNFDSLLISQHHPARDAQDTFFISKPEHTDLSKEDQALVKAVEAEHNRCFVSKWSSLEASRNVLRTHTTGSSAHTLYLLHKKCMETGEFRPGRYYSIDRVFRNEEMDRTHLCEFHQVEGFVIDRNISLAKMMHTFYHFFKRIGIVKLRFKPTFNPYTEPSMEIFGFHTGMNKWIEVGNSGLFRPELLHPLGFKDDISVMAWGLSLERPTMIKYGFSSIHELFGHKVDIKFIKRAPLARF